MAIDTSDVLSKSLYSYSFGTAAPTTNVVSPVTQEFRRTKEKTSIVVYASGLDGTTRLTLKSGNTLTYAELGDLLDADNNPIIIDVENGANTYIVNINSFYVGFGFEALAATTGTVKILAAL
jgi:hypothetical protein